jgi:hypothetical protein
MLLRDHMLDVKREVVRGLRHSTIFTPTSGAFRDNGS